MELLNVYPNPTNGWINIEFNTKGNYSLYSLDGKIILDNKRLESNLITLNISSLKNGMYLLKLITEEGIVITKRVVKQ